MSMTQKIIATIVLIVMVLFTVMPTISVAVEEVRNNGTTEKILYQKDTNETNTSNEQTENETSNSNNEQNIETVETNVVSKEILEKKPELENNLQEEQGEKVQVDEHCITYKLDDKTFKKVYSAYPNTYKDEEGNQKEIDNTLVTENESYTNNANDFDITLPKDDIKEEKPITIEKDNKKLELIPTEGDFSHSVVLENAIRYNNVFDGVDYQYTSLNISLKEDIILNKQVEKNEFAYLVKASDNLEFKQEGNYINVYENEDKVYTIEAPIMEDANGELSAGIQLILEEKEGNKYVKIIADKDWLNAPERVYPVKIDPTITGNQNQHYYFVPVEEYVPNLELGNINYTYVGYDNGKATGTGGSGHGIVRIYSQFDITDIPEESLITNATYTVYQRSTFYKKANSTGVRGEMGLYSVTSDWKGNKSWNNQPFDGQEFIDSQQILDSTGYITYNIRDLVNEWVQGIKPNKGICLKMIAENTMQCELIGSAAAGNTINPAYAPTFSITYTVPDPVDENLPLNALTINLRPMTEKNLSGKLKFDGVFAEGLSKPGTMVNYWINPFEGFIGNTKASYSYKYPNSEPFNSMFPEANKYKDKLGNWQTGAIYTNPQLNKLYRFYAQAVDSENNTSDEKVSDSFVVYQVRQKDTIPYIANYYGVPIKVIMKDNRVQDALLVENNTLFIRNPNKNAETPYNPAPLTDQQKKEIDGALRGRHLHCEYGYEPINLNTGNFYMAKQDASISEINGEFSINRTYNSNNEGYNSMFGKNWDFEYAESLGKLEDGTISYFKGDGKTYYFKPDGNGGFTSPYGTNLTIKEIQYNVEEDEEIRVRFEIYDGNGELRKFNSYGLLTNIIDNQGHDTKIDYTEELEISKITSPTGKVYNFTIQDGKISKIELPNKGILQYEYDEKSNLVKFIDAEGNAEQYQYNDKGQMTACIDKNGVTSVKNEFDEQGRVLKQYDAKDQVVTLQYEDGKTISTDANGNVTTYYYNDRYYTTKIEYPNGATEEKEYDDNGNCIQVKDKSGNITKYEYDSKHNKVKEIRADGAVISTEYNELSKPTKITDVDGKFVTYEYDAKGNLTKTTDNSGVVNSYVYDEMDRLVSKTDGNGNVTSYTYEGANITSVTDANGNTSKIYYNELNQITGVENANGEIKRTTYDKNGNKTLEQFPDGSTNTYSYDAKGRLVATIDAKGNKTEFQYDITDNVVKAIKPDGGIITMEYDANKNKTKEIDELGRISTYKYDSLNRLISEIDANGNETKYEYNNSNNITKVIDANGHSTEMKFDTINNVMLEEKDANENVAKYEYNIIGLLIKKIDKDGLITEYSYDDVNRIKEQKLPTGESITYTYDNNDNVLKLESNSGRNYEYQYDKTNNVIKIIDAMGNEQTISHDKTGNIENVTDVNGAISKYTYNSMGQVIQAQNQLSNIEKFEYDVNGNQTKYIDFNGNETAYEYDSLNRINKKIDALGNTTSYKYDSVGNLIEEIDALGNSTKTEYTNNNQVTKVINANGNVCELQYDKVGNNTVTIDGNGNKVILEYDNEDNLIKATNAEGTITNYEYDPMGRMTAVYDNIGNRMDYTYENGRLIKLQDNTGRTIEYQYDLAGNVTQVKNYDDTISKYEYDLLNRLVKFTDLEGKATIFEYDVKGNLISKTDSTERIWKYEYDKLGNIIKSVDPQNATTSFEYDANSNLLKSVNPKQNEKTYTYDALNRITNITNENNANMAITYDALSRITDVQKPEGGSTKYAYDGVGNKIKQIDELGNETNYNYDANNNLIETITSNGASTKYEYNSLGNVTKVIDALGNITNNKINANGLLEEKILANGAKYKYTYDDAKRLTKVTAPEGVERNFKYDKADNVIEEIDGNGNSTKYEYDIMKRLTGVTNAEGNKTSYEYDNRGNLSSVIDAKGAITKYEYNIVDKLEKQLDPTGVVTEFEYDVLGNLTKEDRAGGRITTYEYDNVGNLTKSTNALGNSKTYTYNKDNNITSAIDELGNKNSYTYDLKGQVTEIINSKNAKKSYTYDANGNVTSITDELGNMKKYNYDLLDRLTEVEDERTAKTSYKYDNVGNMVEQTNANGAVTQYNYDLLNRLKQSIDANGNITTYNYDKESNLTEVIKADGNTINYDYDKINELVSKDSEQDEDINAMYGYDKTGKLIKMEDCLGTTTYEYDEAGRISKVTMQGGKQLAYKYDELSRLNEIVYPDGKSVKYTYDVLDNLQTVVDRNGDTTTYEYDAKSRVTKTIRPNGSYTVISYNELDAVNKLENFVGEQTVSAFEYQYNDKGQIVKETASNQNVTSVKDFAYDERGELLLYKEDIDGKITITTYGYDNAGNRTSKELKVNDQTVTTEYTYNSLNQLLKETTDGKEIKYTYDSNGNLIKKSDEDTTLTYNYTVEDRLQAVKDGNTILMASIYDGNGDRVFSVSPKNYKAKSNNGNHYGQENGNNGNNGNDSGINNNGNGNNNGNNGNHYGNNKNNGNKNNNGNGNNNGNNGNHYGNNKNNEDNEYEEDEEEIPEGEEYTANVIDYNHNGKISVGEMKRANKNKQAETEEIIFIPLGITHQNRNKYELTQYINDVTTENTQVLVEYGKKAKDTVAYNYGNERLSYEDAKNKNKADTFIYNYDGRGSVSNVLDDNGTSMVQYSYDAFGETTISGKQAKKTENTYQFNGESTDKVTGLQYLRARYYDSTTGRFISEDTYSGDMSDPLTLNKYLYTNNDPVNYIDPTGHFLKELWNKAVEYGKATLTTLWDVGKAVWNVVTNPTPQNIVEQVVNTAVKVQNNYSQAKNNINNYNNRSSNNSKENTNNRQQVVNKQVVSKQNNNKTAGAKYNSKVEKAREIENQIRLLRQLGTPDANKMADYLQANMKKLCENGLNKIQISNTDSKTYSSLIEMQQDEFMRKQQEFYKENQEWALSALEGMSSSIIGGGIGLIGGTLAGIGEDILGNGFGYGYTSFNQNFVNPVLQNIRDSAPNKEGYDAGYLTGIVVPLASGLLGLVNSAGKIQSTVNVVNVTNGVASGELVLSGASATELISSFVQASIGVGTGGTSSENKPQDVQNSIKDSSNYPEGFTARQNGTTKNTVKNKELLEELRKVEAGEWKKVYKDGYDINGNKISIHYFQSKSGKVFDVKVKSGWSN